MPLTLVPLTDPAQIDAIWPYISSDAVAPHLPSGFPKTTAEFTLWAAAAATRAHILELDAVPVGLFAFTDIVPDDSAFAHVFIWDHERPDPKEIVNHAKVACAAVMMGFRLRRITGLTPTANLPARLFLTRVGFKVEGTIREALKMPGGFYSDAWISGMTRDDCAAALDAGAAKSAKLEVTPAEELAVAS
jgi:RimJ/RimL family protein N-acetyltransferase